MPGGCVGGVCEISGWCPVENDDDLPTTSPVLKNTDKFTVYIKNSVAFPHFGPQYRRNNIIGNRDNIKGVDQIFRLALYFLAFETYLISPF